jgi:peptidoglycan/xylan/chitin deacetylase (PgdA/CDA1 family)
MRTLLVPGSRTRQQVRRILARSIQAGRRVMDGGRPRAEARIIYYHRIDAEAHRSCVTPRAFREQMQHLRAEGYHTIALPDLATAIGLGLPPAPRTVVVTFDDGFADNYAVAYPVLAALGIPATIFVTVDAVGGRLTVLRDRPEGLPALTWAQLREMTAGPVSIGSHTLSHPNLTALPPDAVRRELVRSREVIAEETGQTTELFCYPRGRRNPAVRTAVHDAGYRAACGTDAGGVTASSDLLALPRTFIARDDTVADFARKLDGAFDYLHHGVTLLRRHLPSVAQR